MRQVARDKRGVVLIFTICILPMLAILGVVFATNARVERDASASYLTGARARMLAISGVDLAAARLRTVNGARAWSSVHDAWFCADAQGTPIAALTKPSYDSNRKSFGIPYSFAEAGTYTAEGDIITLRVSDCASRIYVNGAQPSLGAMLDTLGWAVAAQDNVGAPADGWGDRFLSARDAEPGRAIHEENQLRDLLRAALSQDMADRLMPYLTIHAWVNPSVIAPKPASDGAASEAVPQLSFQKDASGAVVGRAPVDVNTASVPVLAACLAGLAGEELQLAGRSWTFAKTQPIKRDQALTIARLIDAYRQRVADFRTWEEFFAFADGLATAGILNASQADVVKANANPNALTNRLNPNREATLRVDKNDLTFATTEFAFDAMGYFRIESLSRVFSANGNEVASSHVVAEAKVYDVVRLSSQQEFESIRQSSASPSVISVPEQLLARGGSIDRAKRPCAFDGQLVPAPARTNAGSGTVLYDLRTGLVNRARLGVFAPQVMGVTETPSVFSTAARESDLLADGICLDSLRKRIVAFPIDSLRTQKGDVKAGTVEYFVKWDRQAPKTERIGLHGLVAKWRLQSIPLVGSIDWVSRHRILGICDPSDPRMFAVYGANGFNLLGKLKVGYNVTSSRPGTTGTFETGTWRHVAITWRDGYVTNVYVDGTRILGNDYDEGGKRKVNDTRERLLVGCDVDTTSGGTPIPRTAYFAEGTIDGVVATQGKKYDGDFAAPRRYDSRAAVFAGSIPFACERPTVVLRSAAFTAYVPRKDARGRAIAPGMGPKVSMRVQTPGGGWVDVKDSSETAIDSPGRGAMVGKLVASGQRIPVEITFTSTDTAATFDDLTLTYVDGLKFLSFQID